MKTQFIKESLILEVNIIGYKNEGESIVFFIKADDKVVYSGIVDCYEYEKLNKSIEILEENNVRELDFVCWTHPHKDHTVGIEKIIEEYCGGLTKFWIPPFISNDISDYTKTSGNIYNELFSIIRERGKKRKMHIKPVSNACIMDRRKYQIISTMKNVNFQILSFAPDSELIAYNKLNGVQTLDNLYSIGLILIAGDYHIMLAGDVENQTINSIPDENIDYPITYIKIPHHGSSTASDLVRRIYELTEFKPSVATTTIYKKNNLPEMKVLNLYRECNKNIELYSTGEFLENNKNTDDFGIVKTTFDILEKREYQIETELFGNAIVI